MNSRAFEKHLRDYITRAQHARDNNMHHDQRRALFLEFLRAAFDIQQDEIRVEEFVQVRVHPVSPDGAVRIHKGWIDAMFKDLIFEFKRNLKKEEAEGLRELKDYLSSIPEGTECVGLLTDGLLFTAYVLDLDVPVGLQKTRSINLEVATSEAAYLWFDAYLLRQQNEPPTSADLVARFGFQSPTFVAAARILRQALRTFGSSESGALEVKQQQWAFHLARVYGNADVSNDELFVRHTYLCQFAKILAYAAYFDVEEAAREIDGIIDGKAFGVLGVNNIGEQDFFAWVLAPEVRPQTLDVFRKIAANLLAYNLRHIGEDLLKQLYQNLVEPETRHGLGEFYTPDWLAELTLREINYRPGQRLLDPACGSGTFLFTAIRLLAEQGMVGKELVDFALDNIVGMDVHPLAVTISRINYMLAIRPHTQGVRQRRIILVYMANAIQSPTMPYGVPVIQIPIDADSAFQIPVSAASDPKALIESIDDMGRYARNMPDPIDQKRFGEFGQLVRSKFPEPVSSMDASSEQVIWSANLRLLVDLIKKKRDSIWVYVLQNTCSPLFLRYRKFHVIVGNPPWIAYRYIQDEAYQKEIRKLIYEYQLVSPTEKKLTTQMELATLFFEHCRRAYLDPGGTIAFVMPRSVLTAAKQHRAFQRIGFSRIIDLQRVEPLFSVETCVLIREQSAHLTREVPTLRITGKLVTQERKLGDIRAIVKRENTFTDLFQQEGVASAYYYSRMLNGANLYPRNLIFVTSAEPGLLPQQIASSTTMRTDPSLDEEAKPPWKGLALVGHIDNAFLYATLLSKHLVPFGVGKLNVVALPMEIDASKPAADNSAQFLQKRFLMVSLEKMRNSESADVARSAEEWFESAESLWQRLKKTTVKDSLAQWLNYQSKLTAQSAEPGYLVLYGATGTNLTAAVLDTHDLPAANGVQPRAFVVDHKTYWYRSSTPDEAHFLVALLNAPFVDHAIKLYQTRGLYGERDIHRRPFEVCAIPRYDPGNSQHQQLVTLSQEAHREVAQLDLSTGRLTELRRQARRAAETYVRDINVIAQDILRPQPAPERLEETKPHKPIQGALSYEKTQEHQLQEYESLES